MTMLKRKLKYPPKIGVFGLSKAGKTWIVAKMGNEPVEKYFPTTKVNLKKIETSSFIAWVRDAPGQLKYHDDWERIIEESEYIFYVVDACDKDLLDDSLKAFKEKVEPYLNKNQYLFFLVNKQDLLDQNPLSADEVKEKFGIPAYYYGTSAVTGLNFQDIEQKIVRLATKKQ